MINSDSFALEITDSALKIFDGQINQNDIEVKNISLVDNLPFLFFSQETPDIRKKLAEIIKETLARLKINKRKVNLVIPDTYTYSQIISMPMLNEKELISAIKYQADQFIPLPIEEINIDLQILSRNEKEKTLLVLVVAASKKLVNKIEETIELSNLIPNILENQLSSFARFASKFSFSFPQNVSQKIAFINFGQFSTSLYLFDRSTALISKIHTFNLGYNLFFKEMQVNTALDNNKISELFLSFDLKNKNPIDLELTISPVIKQFVLEIKKSLMPDISSFLIGEVFRFPALPALLSKNISPASFSIFNPYSIFKSNPQIDHYKNLLPFFVTTFGSQIE